MLSKPEDFSSLEEGAIYFDSAATSLKPKSVIDTISHFYGEEYGTVHRAVYKRSLAATAKYNQVREQAQKFLHAASLDEIVFTKGTTDAINLVANTFIQPGDEVIISEMEHHSNIVPWQLRRASLKIIPITDKGELDLEAFKKLLTPKTKLVSIAHISNALGTCNPIAEIIRLAHTAGAKVCVDGAQAAAHLPVDVQALDVDFYAFSSHKAFGPTGVGILYGKYELLEKMPPYQGGGDMIQTVTFEETTFRAPPLRFEAGTPPIAQVIGLGAALSYIESIGRATIAAYEHQLLTYATEKLNTIPNLRIIGTAPNKGAIISFVIDGLHPLDIGTLLDKKNISVRTGHQCAQPAMRRFGLSATVRLSFAPYNTTQEIDRFIAALHSVIQLLK
jgi:cysteine desulfurase/selenocysteine lyase